MEDQGVGGAVAALNSNTTNSQEPIFSIERVQLQFSLAADFVAGQVANNILVLALTTGRIMRIDLENPADIEDIDLPKKSSEVGLIRRLFLDPSASHLIINTTFGENFYLHAQSRMPKLLPMTKGIGIESVAWNPSLPTASTREILIGASDGNIYETFIEPQSEFYRKEQKYFTNVYRIADNPVTGLWVGFVDGHSENRQILVCSSLKLLSFAGKLGHNRHEGLYGRLFEAEAPTIREAPEGSSRSAPSTLTFSPDLPDVVATGQSEQERIYTWLNGYGALYGSVLRDDDLSTLGNRMFNSSKAFAKSRILSSAASDGPRRPSSEPIRDICLTQWHLLCLVEGRLVAVNRLDGKLVYDQAILEPRETVLGMYADIKKNTFWLLTPHDIFEVAVTNEDRDVWRIMLREQKFEAALQYAQGDAQKDVVAKASGDHLIQRGQFMEAALVFGKSSKPFEEVALIFIDHNEQDALRKYLLAKIIGYKRNQVMQRMMIASWLIEIFMSKMNSLDDTITTKAELAESQTTRGSRDELALVQREYHDFVNRFSDDLDHKTAYEIIGSHGREDELLTFAAAIDDSNFILSYWIQRERWREALNVLKRQTDADMFYRYASVLMRNTPTEFVDILMRQANLNPRRIIPALLNYAQENESQSIQQNQAARYLHYCVDQLGSTDSAVHNTLISVYASHSTSSEFELMRYLSFQSAHPPPRYDADFALRLCIQHNRVESCVHIYSLMGQYAAAVDLALRYGKLDLAALVADRPADSNPALRKTLWLTVAKRVISSESTGSIRQAIEFLRRCDLLRIEDLIPFFPDFVVVDDFKDEICAALEAYSRQIDQLKEEMDESSNTAQSIKDDICKLDRRYTIVQPGESCRVCDLPLLSRQFFVFPSCQHGFHSDCLGKSVVEGSGLTARNRIRELQTSVSRGTQGPKREKEVRELDGLVGKECILCNDFAIKLIEEPFANEIDGGKEWLI